LDIFKKKKKEEIKSLKIVCIKIGGGNWGF